MKASITAGSTALLAALVLIHPCRAQQGPPAEVLAADFSVAIHSLPPDPVLGEYGTWAAGPTYKASFHDGFAFYPLLGPSYSENLPLRWVETSIAVAGRELRSGHAPEREHTDWRYEYRHAGWTEAYDVQKDGVEQSFVFDSAPLGAGDLVITGAIQTRLRAAARAPDVAPIVFTDQSGEPLIEYGSALAFDAAGRSTAVATSFDGTSIRLHVPGQWLGAAVYPVTVDPLTSRFMIGGELNSRRVRDTDTIVAADRADPHSLLIVHSREFTSGDIDAFAFMYDKNFRNTGHVWNEISTSWNTLRPRCTFMNPTNEWLIAFERQVGSSSWVRLYSHRRTNLVSNSGTVSALNNPSGKVSARPDVGGQLETNQRPARGLVVFEERSFSDPTISDVKGVIFNATTHQFGTPFLIPVAAGGTAIRRTQPSVSSMTSYGTPWMATWQEILRGSTDDWDIQINLVLDTGQVFTATGIPANNLSGHKTGPVVEGDDVDYLLAYTVGSTISRRIEYQRVHWPIWFYPPTNLRQRTLVSGTLGSFPSLQGLGFDYDTRSHWCLMNYRSGALTATRVGQTGGVIESGTVHASGGIGAGSVSFTRGTGTGPSTVLGRFVLVHSDDALFYPIYASHMTYPHTWNTYFGSGCNGGAQLREVSETGQALAGNGNFGYLATGLTPGASALLVFGLNSGFGQIPGAPGCDLYLDPAVLIVGQSTTAGLNGSALFPLPLPDDPIFTGDLYTQCIWLDPQLNALGLGTTNGMIAPVR